MSDKEKPTPTAPPSNFKPTPPAAPSAKAAPDITESWQWDGSTDSVHWPHWILKHGAVVDGKALRLNTPGGMITATRHEWIVRDAKGVIHVTKDAPPDKKHV